MPRERFDDEAPPDRYKLRPRADLTFFSSGSTLFDCVLGGGYPRGRMINLVGDESTAKTGFCVEACANFRRQYPKGPIEYDEVEDAFDLDYARSLGLPKDVHFPDPKHETVEAMYRNYSAFIKKCKPQQGGLYIVDSWDALSNEAEEKADIGKAGYGTDKAKRTSQMFRRMVRKAGTKNVTLLVVSQTRDNVGVTYGEKKTWSGGRALRFYASLILILSAVKNKESRAITREKKDDIERDTGIMVRVRCYKSKVARPSNVIELPVIWDYGIDDLGASVNWLHSINRAESLGVTTNNLARIIRRLRTFDKAKYEKYKAKIDQLVHKHWVEVEELFTPTRKKYA